MEATQPVLGDDTLITADSGYHSEANLQALAALGVDALIADNEMRRRDERFATQERHQQGPDPLHDKTRTESREGRAHYERRFGTVEPVFANVRRNKRLDRFTLRGRTKVDAQ